MNRQWLFGRDGQVKKKNTGYCFEFHLCACLCNSGLTFSETDPAMGEFIIFKGQTHIPYSSPPIPSLMSFSLLLIIEHAKHASAKLILIAPADCGVEWPSIEKYQTPSSTSQSYAWSLGSLWMAQQFSLGQKNKMITAPFYLLPWFAKCYVLEDHGV